MSAPLQEEKVLRQTQTIKLPVNFVRKSQEIEKRLAEIREQEAASQQLLFLPGLEEFMRAMPNHLARSSLFAPVARGRKEIYKEVILESRKDAVIKYSGEQLDESQADVWMQAMQEAIKVPFGEPVVIKRAGFLKAIGRNTSGESYHWLHRTMKELAFAMLVIEVYKDGKPKLTLGKTRALHLIEGFDYDDEAEAYTLRIDPRWRAMYGNSEFALIDWNKRMQIGHGQDMAKALQRLIATSDESVQRYELGWLKRKLGYSSPMHKFRKAIKAAMSELERVEIIAGGWTELSTKGKEQAVWTKLK